MLTIFIFILSRAKGIAFSQAERRLAAMTKRQLAATFDYSSIFSRGGQCKKTREEGFWAGLLLGCL
jgi:hypothetical protein